MEERAPVSALDTLIWHLHDCHLNDPTDWIGFVVSKKGTKGSKRIRLVALLFFSFLCSSSLPSRRIRPHQVRWTRGGEEEEERAEGELRQGGGRQSTSGDDPAAAAGARSGGGGGKCGRAAAARTVPDAGACKRTAASLQLLHRTRVEAEREVRELQWMATTDGRGQTATVGRAERAASPP